MSKNLSTSKCLLVFLLLGGFIGQLPAQCDCEPENRMTDSIALIRFYESMGGQNWREQYRWDLEDEYTNWFGLVRVTEEGCLRCLDLDSDLGERDNTVCGLCRVWSPGGFEGPEVRVTGTWPDDFVLPCLQKLSLSHNPLDIPLPDFSGFSNLCEMYLTDDRLKGEINWAHLTLPRLRTLNMGRNSMSGELPANIRELMPELTRLLLDSNELSGLIPDVSHLIDLDLEFNNFTFEDIIPNFQINSAVRLIYSNQAPVFRDTIISVGMGLPFELDLMIDDTITSSTYRWFKSGETEPVRVETENKLFFPEFSAADAGTYRCEINNSVATELTLRSFPITLIDCLPGENRLAAELCDDETIMVEGIAISRDTSIILRGRSATGCDSVIYVSITDLGGPVESRVDTFFCRGDSILFEGAFLKDEGLYQYNFPGGSARGCDSTLLLEVVLVDEDWVRAELPEDFIVCEPEVTLTGSLPALTTGAWAVDNMVLIEEETEQTAIFSNLQPGPNKIRWYLSTGGCLAYDSAEVEVYYESPVTMRADRLQLYDAHKLELESSDLNVLDNDDGWEDLLGTWSLEIVSNPERGSAELLPDGTLMYTRQPCFRGEVELEYIIVGENCPSDTAVVTLTIDPLTLTDQDMPPDVITPDGDGKNDRLIIPAIHFHRADFPNVRLAVFDENNNQVYEQENYDNLWEGVNHSGRTLPEGMYHFLVDYQQGLPAYRGNLLIMRR